MTPAQPDDSCAINAQQQKLIADQQEQIKQQQATITTISEQYEKLRQQLVDLRRQHFGSKTERYIPEQGLLFDFSETDATSPEEEYIEGFHRRKPKKKHPHHIISEHLPRVRVEYELAEDERLCPCGCGAVLQKMGEEVSERLEYKPAELYVKQHVRFKYGGCLHDLGLLIAPMPTLPIARSIAGPSLVAHIAVDKYQFHQPLHRQQRRLAMLGIKLNDNTFYDWVRQSGDLLMVLYRALIDHALRAPIMHTDDTPAKVRIKGQSKAKRGYFWIYVGHGCEAVSAVYVYTENRSQEGPKAFLNGYEGYVQADAYSGYDVLFNVKDVEHPRTEVGCWMHARRRFYKIVVQSKKAGAAHEAMKYIRALYKIEEDIKTESADKRKQIRQEQSKPLLETFKEWLDKKADQVLPKSLLYDAVQYSLNHWQALTRYLEDGRIEMDNGKAERGMRPIALGRKNWVALGSHRGGHLAAIYFSFIETCKIYKINSYEYLTDVLTRINDHPANRIDELLPHAWAKARIEKEQPAVNDTS